MYAQGTRVELQWAMSVRPLPGLVKAMARRASIAAFPSSGGAFSSARGPLSAGALWGGPRFDMC